MIEFLIICMIPGLVLYAIRFIAFIKLYKHVKSYPILVFLIDFIVATIIFMLKKDISKIVDNDFLFWVALVTYCLCSVVHFACIKLENSVSKAIKSYR